jgi:polysaccharide biosynthesis protein PelD
MFESSATSKIAFGLDVLMPARVDRRHFKFRVSGVRGLALLEITAFLVIALTIDHVWGRQDRFMSITPHPFWIVIILASSYYGVREGLASVVLSSLVLLIGNLPQQNIDEMNAAWLMRAMSQPVLWCITALILGSLADAFRHRLARLKTAHDAIATQLQIITDDYVRLQSLNQHLEARVASQVCTVNAMYKASRSIERLGTGEVLVGVTSLVRQVLNPAKFSLFLLNAERLEAVANEGWASNESFSGDIDEHSTLYAAIVLQRRFLVATSPADASILGTEGVLAGPLINEETGDVVGMLKIEAIEFLDLNWTNVQNFRVICNWIGEALANAQRIENMLDGRSTAPSSETLRQ